MQNVIQMIINERSRQLAKGFTPDHDDQHSDGSIMHAAMLILVDESGFQLAGVEPPSADGPWPDQLLLHIREKYSTDAIRKLTIAIALIVAEIERLQRAAAPVS